MSRPPSAIAWRRMPMLGLVVLITLWVAWESLRLVSADMVSLGARRQVASWIASTTAQPDAAALAKADTALHAALSITPENPVLHEQLGDLYMLLARVEDDVDKHAQAYDKAIQAYRDAIARRPADPQTWVALASAWQGPGGRDDEVLTAWRESLQLGPHEGYTQPMLLGVALRMWNDAPDDMRQWAQDFYAASPQRLRTTINARAAEYGVRFVAEDEEEAFSLESSGQEAASPWNHR